MHRQYYVYIMTNKNNTVLYTGMTNDLIRRVYEHKKEMLVGFISKYKIHMLVYFEVYEDIYNANTREKRIKAWKRQWKIELIESTNPEWKDLYEDII